MGLADRIVVRFGKGKPMLADDKAPEDDAAPSDDGDAKPGMKGKMLIKAIKSGDGEAVEEILKSIC